MKKILVLTIVFAISCIFLMGCGSKGDTKEEKQTEKETTVEKTGADALLGDWTYESGGFTYHFKDDGTGVYDIGGEEMTFTYSATDDVLTISFYEDTDPMELDYEISGDTLNVKDSLGNDTIYKKK